MIGGPMSDRDQLVADQIAYYRARAPEYEKDILRVEGMARLPAALDEFRPEGRVLELACGSGRWTERLLPHASSVTGVDAAPEMLAMARERIDDERVRFIEADIFGWRPEERYDVAFFAFWLSHVPPERFDAFWSLVADCLEPDGRVFFVDDRHRTQDEWIEGEPALVQRRLRDGRTFRAVKVPHEPADLERRLTELGWNITVTEGPGPFYWGAGTRA
jgi:SAM-dependent methyltransferase